MELSTDKSEVFSHPITVKQPGSPQLAWMVNKCLLILKEYTWIELWLFAIHFEVVSRKASACCRVVSSLAGRSWGWKTSNLRRFYQALIASVMNYAAAGWQPWLSAVGKQRSTCRAAHKDHDRLEECCRGWPGHLEQPPRRPVDFITVQRYICEKTLNLFFIWLLALLRSSLIGCYTNWHIHSFIQGDSVCYCLLWMHVCVLATEADSEMFGSVIFIVSCSSSSSYVFWVRAQWWNTAVTV